MLQSRGVRRTTAAAVAVLGLLLGGCGGDDAAPDTAETPSTTPTDTPSTSATPTPTASPAPELPPAPPAKDGPAGREAFARFVVDRWSYALRTNDAEAVTALSPATSPCRGCRDLREELAQRRKEGWFVDFPGAEVRRVRLARQAPDSFLATMTVDIPASRSYFDDGAFRNDNEAHPGASFQVLMRLDKKRYTLLAFQVG